MNFDPQLPQRIDVDPGRLRQIILNLLTNAIKFSTPSLAGKTGAVSLCLTRDEKDRLLIAVSDNGIGIDVKNHQGAVSATGKRRRVGFWRNRVGAVCRLPAGQ